MLKNVSNGLETTPFVWNDSIVQVTQFRDFEKSNNEHLELVSYFPDKFVYSKFGNNTIFPSAIVHQNVLRIFATQKATNNNDSDKLLVFKTVDLKTLSEPKTINLVGKNTKLFNTSVAFNPDSKKFIMAYEIDEKPFIPFSIRFAESNDLENWKTMNIIYSPNEYAACPTIIYQNGLYYMIYLTIDGNRFISRISRSQDLMSWELSPIPFLEPDSTDGINASDIDLVEYKGKTYIFYLNGDRKSWGYMNSIVFNDNIQALLKTFFEKPKQQNISTTANTYADKKE